MDSYSKKVLDDVVKLKPVVWENPKKERAVEALSKLDFKYEDIMGASKRLERFASLIKVLFPETEDGIIESPLVEISKMKASMEEMYNKSIKGRLLLKCDSHLKIAGSIKARGGIYEVLKHAETLALENGLLKITEDYSKLADKSFKEFFSRYEIGVGSTGNLGLSIGIMSAALGFKVTVHMSRDAKEWKKQLLRSKGAIVIEYEDDYSRAVEEGRKQCMKNPMGYFIDDENSKDLFMGYSVAAMRIKNQLDNMGININNGHKLRVYLPCGVGGAPGGIAFGLKHVFGDNVECYFVEPTHSPCMLLGLITEKYSSVHVREYGIDNVTEADGLAVGSPSKLVSMVCDKLLDGEYTVEDDELFKLLALLKDSENIKIEPSAASSLLGPVVIDGDENTINVCWATGGLLVPDEEYEKMYKKGKEMIK